MDGVQLVSIPELQSAGWNVKATLLLHLLRIGHSQVIWLDSDILLNGEALSKFTSAPLEVFGASEEAYWGQTQGSLVRTVAWGLKPGRHIPYTLNSGILRVTHSHVDLLAAWQKLLQHPLYTKAQTLRTPSECPLHMITDQDVLTALLGSAHFAGVPLLLLKRGVDIAQCFGAGGFTPWERIRCIFSGLPPLVHAMGTKPWEREPNAPKLRLSASGLREYLEFLHLELTPYNAIAQQFRPALSEDLQWADLVTIPARMFNFAAAGSAILREFPLSIFDSAAKMIRRWLKVSRYEVRPEFCLNSSPLQEKPEVFSAAERNVMSAGA
jgi:hypothetical protein